MLGAGMWVLGIPLSFVIRDKPERYGSVPDGTLLDDPIPQLEIEGKTVEIGFKEARKKRSFLYLNLIEAIRIMALATVVTHVMPYLSSAGISRPTAGLVAGGIPLFSVIGRFGFGVIGWGVGNSRLCEAAVYPGLVALELGMLVGK